VALSNVRSSAYRSAGGKAWNNIKSGFNSVSWDGPETAQAIADRHYAQDEQDQYMLDKAALRGKIAEGYQGIEIQVIPAGKSGVKKRKSKGKRCR